MFDLQKELDKLNIKNIEIQKGDVWQLGEKQDDVWRFDC